MDEKQMASPGIHILLYPYPTAGHIIPILDLARNLLVRPGLAVTVTVLVTPDNSPLLEPLLLAHPPPALQPLVLPAPPRAPPTSSVGNRLVSSIRGLRDLHLQPLLEWFGSHASPPDAIVSDFFLGWTHHLALQLGIPRVVFSPSGAFAQSVSCSQWRDLPELAPEVSFPNLPNSPSFPISQISEVYKNYIEGVDPSLEFHRDGILANVASWGLVVNSFAELEGAYIDHLKRDLGHDRVWAVGPLLPPDDDEAGQRGGSSSIPAHEVVTWLDSCDDGSVVYVCFGSRAVLTREQISELAAGLEQSGARFVLCLRKPDEGQVAEGYNVLPDGFEDRVAGRGLVIRGWAPQVVILRHRAVRAFLTHCGWNSTMEGITAGVVMLTWPMGADQFTNAKLLVDQLGVGMRVGEGNKKLPEAAELARTLRDSIGGARLKSVRAGELKKAALTAKQPGGSSVLDLDRFINRLVEFKISK